jgi:hypothetical protein
MTEHRQWQMAAQYASYDYAMEQETGTSDAPPQLCTCKRLEEATRLTLTE